MATVLRLTSFMLRIRYFDTRLIAPDKGEKVSNQASYPYIVIKTELSEMPVVFE